MLRSAEGQYQRQTRISATAASAVRRLWRRLGVDFSRDWERVGPQIFDVTQSARAAAVVTALPYTAATLAEQGVVAESVGALSGARFMASAPSGAPLAQVLEAPLIRTKALVGQGMPTRLALEQGGRYLSSIILTLMADTRRSVYGADIISRPKVGGYVRMLQAPSCSRCVILAGKFFRWNQGFQRHPNCFPAGVAVSGPAVEGATRRWYEGELVVLTTASGQELPVTGNHPVLTSRGWVPANLIQEGDEVVRSTRTEGATSLVIPDHDQVPARIENVWDALRVRGLVRVPATPEDFHGDGQYGEVDVVRADGALDDGVLAALAEHVQQEHLTGASLSTEAFAGQGSSQVFDLRHAPFAGGAVGCLDLGSTLVLGEREVAGLARFAHPAALDSGFGENPCDWAAGNAVLLGEAVFGGSGDVLLDDLLGGEVERRPRWDAPGRTFSVETAEGYARVGRDLLERLAGQVELDRVVQVRRVDWSGHVYSLTSSEGWHSANSLIVSNCDCIHVAVGDKKGAEGLVADPYEYFNSLSQEEQDKLFGRSNARAIRDGGDIYRVENVRLRGLSTANGRGRDRWYSTMTVDDIYRTAGTRTNAIRMLEDQGYIRGPQVLRQAPERFAAPISRPVVSGSARDRVLTARATGIRDPLDTATMTAQERRLYDAWYKLNYAQTRGAIARSTTGRLSSADLYTIERSATSSDVLRLRAELDDEFARQFGSANAPPDSVIRLAALLGLI